MKTPQSEDGSRVPREKEDGTGVCPRCGGEAWPIVRGMWFPDPANPEPKVIHTGCVVHYDDPRHRGQCINEYCKYGWS